MRIAIDARWIFPEISGIGNYTRQLLTQYGRMDIPHTLLLLFNDQTLLERTLTETGLTHASNIEAHCLPWGVFSPKSQLRLPSFLKRERADVFHSPNYMIPFAAFPRHRTGRTACVTTIHDVIPLLFPDHAPKSRKTRLFPIFRALMNEVGRRSDIIVTVSETSRQDIIKQLHIPTTKAGNVHTVYNGVSDHFSPSEVKSPKKSESITLLYVGRSDPYKNVETLIKALNQLRRTTTLDVQLKIAGAPDPRYPQAAELAQTLGISHAVNWTGYLSDAALVEEYRNADLLVHPSRYEGFGLQILEAMACGTPVISSNAGSLTEVAGDAAILFDPLDTQKLADSIAQVLTHPDIADNMRQKGLKQAAQFTWETAARKTMALYEAACAMNPGVS